MMKVADDVTLDGVQDEKNGNRSTVVVGGTPTRASVSGSVLEAAIRCDPGWLVFLTDDTPFEEMLHIGLVRLQQPDTVRFRFLQDADWSVRVLPRPRLGIPFRSDVRFAWRGSRLRRHFVVDRFPRR